MPIRVLIVEDDPDDIFLIKEYLSQDKSREYKLTECHTLQEVLDLKPIQPFDVILLDLGLPDASGMEALNILSRRETASPIIVLTVNNDELGEKAIHLGAADYLPKQHTDYITLSRSIRHTIERYSLILELKEKAETDPLTGLANRGMLYDKLEFMIDQCERSNNSFALVMMDFDKFKEINDTKGHLYGDLLLKGFANRLNSIKRKSDYAARFGGDEFLMIMANFKDEAHLKALVEQKQSKLRQAYEIELGGEIHRESIDLSIGIMLWERSITAQMMLEKADEAMYRSKKDNLNSITVYR